MFNFIKKIISLIYENSCAVCGSSSKELIICHSCEKDFKVRSEIYKRDLDSITVFSWGFYDGSLRSAIIALKNNKKDLANYFASKLSKYWENLNVSKEDFLILPVPSHKRRLKERGYCQTELIAEEISRNLNLRFSKNHIERIKETKFMNSLNLIERKENIAGAFKIVKDISSEKDILIIDDILTTGSTFEEISRTIKSENPEANLIGLTIASGDDW